jgi:hypothetical protein
MGAIEPLAEFFLELGISSPEAESLWRAVFVHKARDWLAAREGGGQPSDVRVALVSGVHRNFVSRLLAEPPKISARREQKGHRASRLLEAWHSSPAYVDSGGKPRDLPERGCAPSFEALVAEYLPGTPFRVVFSELDRAGAIQQLADRRVRVLSRSIRKPGVNLTNVSEMGKSSAAYLRTLIFNLHRRADSMISEALPPIEIEQERIPIVREVIYRRTIAFLRSLEAELASERRRVSTKKQSVRAVSISIFETRGSREDSV